MNHIEFYLNPVEDRDASNEAGHYVTKDVEMLKITIPGGNLVVEKVVTDALRSEYSAIYEQWKKGEDIPENGSALKLWPPISPAHLKNCIALHIRTVEQLAEAPDNLLKSIGPGAAALKRKAADWLKAASDIGVSTAEIEKLKVRIDELETENKDLKADLAELLDDKPKRGRPKSKE